MEEILFMGRQLSFTAPSGNQYDIREQNGEDDDILSHTGDARTLMNVSRFIAGLVTNTTATKSGKLTAEEAHNLPVLDRYCILIQSRIHSMGNILEFKYDWPKEAGGTQEYEVELNDYLLDYSKELSELLLEEANIKPDAIPVYPLGKKFKDIEFTTTSGKELCFDLLTGASESKALLIPDNDKTKNTELLVRNLRLKVDGTLIPVTRFHLFNSKEMAEIRNYVKKVDPLFTGNTELENPSTNEKAYINIMGIPDFFYPGEI